ncbi:nuclear pore complex subunit Nro1-domain-containing protein [Chytriomyces sp. MP71]|nr:nuclear pore complex subunit Nro1-domain-containing protein [Chytriomyces sp. MP71]
MFEIALAKLDKDEEAEEGMLMLRGVIHESDRILRSRFENVDEEAEAPPEPLPSTFHWTYGSALFRLGLLILEDEENDDAESEALQYIEAAIDRYDTGLEQDGADKDWKLNEAMARAVVEKANLTLRQDPTYPLKKIDALIATAFKHISLALSILASNDHDESVAVLLILIRHAQLREDTDGAKKWLNTARVELNKLLKVDPTHTATLQTLAQTYMSAANDLLDAAEQSGAAETDLAAVGKLVDEALKYLHRAENKSGSAADVKLQLLLGEVYVNKANLLDEEDDETKANEFYKKAVECFQRVQGVDAKALPEEFDSFLKEWEADLE